MSIASKYNPAETESKWYDHWLQQGFFKSKPNPDKEPFTILIPPPNVTGVLHMGHMLNNTIQDILIRKARMEGKEACWIPGTDHASIATEAKVVGKLREQGITKADLTREEFLEHAMEWKEQYGGIILNQLKTLGASCDWDRTFFTMDPKLSEAVVKVFVDLNKKGYLYRGLKMVNWDPKAQTTLSNEEVIHKDVKSKLYHVRYKIEGSDATLTIATTRPETILGDTAICINPKDERHFNLKGKRAIVPLVNRSIPVIEDEYVDLEFGTGCLKVTPAHDTNDYDLGQKHNLESIDILNDDGTMSEAAQYFVGEDRFKARRMVVAKLEELGLIDKIEEIDNKVGYSERNPDTVVEPKLSQQWFVDMEQLVKPAMQHVMNDDIQFYPPKFKNTYKHWLENIRDWPISRQLWWGQQIPAYYYGDNQVAVAASKEEALEIAKKDSGNANLTLADLKQDEDVVDTWFSSWLLPVSVFDGFDNPNNEEFNYYYPTSVLVTGWDIIFFWVARMIFAGYEFGQDMPFKKVYFTGMVRDMQRRKMSKSLGNSPDLLGLIKQYGADAVRVGMMLSSAAGNDLMFDEKLCLQGRNFANKIWNAFRLVKGFEIDTALDNNNQKAIEWFDAKLNETLVEIEDHFSKFRISDALMAIYKLVWDDFCSWYLEMIKPNYGEKIDQATYDKTIDTIEKLMQLLHPFMPFLTEEIWNNLHTRSEKDCVVVSEWPKAVATNPAIIEDFDALFEVVSNIRNTRNSKQISPKEKLDLILKTEEGGLFLQNQDIIKKLAGIKTVETTTETIENATSFVVNGIEFHIPLEGNIDIEKEKEAIVKEIEYAKGFLKSVDKKLSNERFVNNAPEKVLAIEHKKKADAESKIKALEESLANIG